MRTSAVILALGLLLPGSPITSDAAEPAAAETQTAEPAAAANTPPPHKSGQQAAPAANDTEHAQALRPRRRIVGRVTDAQTGQPIEQVIIIPLRYGSVCRADARDYCGKRFDVELETDESQLRFEAEGYRAAMSDKFDTKKPVSLCEIRLVPAPAAAGRVVGPDGTPVAGARVFLATPTQSLNISGGDMHANGRDAALTDAAGAFAFPAQFERYMLVAMHDLGYAEVALNSDQLPGKLQLAAWARVAGRLLEAGQPVANTGVWLEPVRPRKGDDPAIFSGGGHETDEQGRFVFERVPPLQCTLSVMEDRENRFPIRSGESVPLTLKPGDHVTQDLGAGGATVRGRVALKGETADDLQWMAHYDNWLAPEGTDPLRLFEEEWPRTGIPLGKVRHHYFVKLAGDGTFLISGVPAGQYNFAIAARPQGVPVTSPYKNPQPARVIRFRVAESDVAAGALDLGLFELDAPAGPQPGELFPDFDFETLDGRQKKLSGQRGLYVLIGFCRRDPEGRDTSPPAVGQIHDQYAADGRLVVIGLSFYPETEPPKRQTIQKHPERWMQGFLPRLTDVVARFGVDTAPLYFLIDPDGKLVSKHYTADGAKKKIAALLDAAQPAAVQ